LHFEKEARFKVWFGSILLSTLCKENLEMCLKKWQKWGESVWRNDTEKIEEIRRPIAVREADACRSFQEEEVGKSIPWELVEVQPRGFPV
jgi:hypothetical protein